MSAIATTLGLGIYSPAEAAFHAQVDPRALIRWVFGDSAGQPVIERQLQQSADKIVTFLDLIQVLAVREARNRHRVSLQKLREAVDQASRAYGIQYPLARSHKIFLFGDPATPRHQQIVIELQSDINHEHIQLTGKHKGNRLLSSIIEPFLNDITFDPNTQLASQYRPMSEGEASILLDPTRRFGEPIIEPSGYTAEALWHATNSEGSLEDAAATYGVSLAEVELANQYFNNRLIMKVA